MGKRKIREAKRLEARKQALSMIQTRHTEVNLGKWKWKESTKHRNYLRGRVMPLWRKLMLFANFFWLFSLGVEAWHFLVPLPLSGAM